jgi:hypothetical protein
MAANSELIGIRRRRSFAPLVMLLVLAGAIAVTYVVTRPQPAPSPEVASASSFGLGRDALVAAGYTGRLGATTEFDGWRPAAHPSGVTPRTGSESSPGDGWLARAMDPGFIGGLTATFDPIAEPSELPPYVIHQRQ